MTNKYLTKIAGLPPVGGILKSVHKNVLKPAIGVGKDLGNAIGRDVHTALGGGYRDVANFHGITSQKGLRDVKDAKSLSKALESKGKTISDEHLDTLHNNRNKAIIKSVGYAGAAAYGGNKILDKVKERNQQQYY